MGALLGLGLAIIVGWLIYSGSMRLNLAAFLRWTGLFIVWVAAGILANSVQALHEAGVWNHLQQVVFDLSASLPMDGPLGSVLAGMLGYQDAPTVSTLGAYGIYLLVALVLLCLPVSAPAKPPASPSSSASSQ
jgi:high-affinity iron transporter